SRWRRNAAEPCRAGVVAASRVAGVSSVALVGSVAGGRVVSAAVVVAPPWSPPQAAITDSPATMSAAFMLLLCFSLSRHPPKRQAFTESGWSGTGTVVHRDHLLDRYCHGMSIRSKIGRASCRERG